LDDSSFKHKELIRVFGRWPRYRGVQVLAFESSAAVWAGRLTGAGGASTHSSRGEGKAGLPKHGCRTKAHKHEPAFVNIPTQSSLVRDHGSLFQSLGREMVDGILGLNG
jgi:hypothetical protein